MSWDGKPSGVLLYISSTSLFSLVFFRWRFGLVGYIPL